MKTFGMRITCAGLVLALAIIVALAACGSPAPTPTPTPYLPHIVIEPTVAIAGALEDVPWWTDCPAAPACATLLPTHTPAPTPTCRATPTCVPRPTSTPHPEQPTYAPPETDGEPLPTGTPAPTPTPTPTSFYSPISPLPTPITGILYGAAWIAPYDLPDVTALGAELVTIRTYGPGYALNFLDRANERGEGLRVVLYLVGAGDWGWNGESFDLSFLGGYSDLAGHPALLAIHGLSDPWRFTPDQLRRFYRAWKVIAPGVAIWHDMGHLTAEFSPGMCDYCQINVYPYQSGGSNRWNEVRAVLAGAGNAMAYAATYEEAGTLCAHLQAFGDDGRGYRMPTASEMRETARVAFGEYGLRCGLWTWTWTGGEDLADLPGRWAVVADVKREYFDD